MRKGIRLRSKIVCGMLALAATALMAGWNASEAEAANTFGGLNVRIHIDYDQQTMHIIDQAGDAQLQVGLATYKKATKMKDAYLTVSAWELYDNTVEDGGVTVDLSRLKNTNDNYIEIKGNNNSEPIAILFPQVEKSVTASYNAKLGKVEIYSSAAAKKNGEDPITEGIEYRTATGRWNRIEDMEEHSLAKYQQSGATLYYRLSAQYDTDIIPEETGIPLDVSEEAEEEIGGVPLYTAGSFAGVEKKVTISKLANGPKITVNYVTGQLSLGVGQEYRTFDTDLESAAELASIEFTPVDEEAKKAVPTDLNLKKPFTIELRKFAVEEKSLATKVTQLACAKQGTTYGYFEDSYRTDKAFDIINKTLISNRVYIMTDDEVPSEEDEDAEDIGALQLYGEYNKVNKKYTLNIYNYNQLYGYDIIVVDANEILVDDVSAKKYTAVAKNTTKLKKITVSGDNKVVYARRQANTSLKSWRTEWKPIGKLVPKN